jgi:oligosaccharide reducing-end xylanase
MTCWKAIAGLIVLGAAQAAGSAPVQTTHHYPNLFVERLGRSPAETRAKVDAAFRQLFHGDGQEQRLYFETGANANGQLSYITDWAYIDARTEGMSFGMLIAFQLD